jgi:hypothetical protein
MPPTQAQLASDSYAVREKAVLDAVRTALGQNAAILAVSAVVVVIACVVLLAIARELWSVVSDWYKRRSGWDLGPLAKKPLPGRGGRRDPGADDDIEYPDPDAGKPPEPPSGARIKARIAKLKALYAPYNKAITDYVAQTRGGALPDDLIDERVLSRADDDFKYGKDAGLLAPPEARDDDAGPLRDRDSNRGNADGAVSKAVAQVKAAVKGQSGWQASSASYS